MPQDMRIFQRNRYVIKVRHHSCRIVRWWAGRRHSRAVNVAARRAGQLSRQGGIHFLPHRATAVDSISIELDSHGLRVKVIEINLNLKDVLLALGFKLHFAEA